MNDNDHVPAVSVGLPVYNGAQFISRALESILAQDFEDFEVVICDNASTDDTVAICQEFAARDSRIRLYQNDHNLGAAPNFSRVFELSKGTYFKWMAHDDWIEPSLLRKSVDALETMPDVVLCYPKTRIFSEQGELLSLFVDKIDISGDDPSDRFTSILNRLDEPFSVFGLMRVDEMKKTPLMRPISGGDRPFLAEMSLLGKFYLIPEYLFANRTTESARSQRIGPNKISWWNTANTGRYLPRRPALIKEYISIIARSEIPARKKPALYMKTIWRFSKIRRKTLAHYGSRDKMMPFREMKHLVGSIFNKPRRR